MNLPIGNEIVGLTIDNDELIWTRIKVMGDKLVFSQVEKGACATTPLLKEDPVGESYFEDSRQINNLRVYEFSSHDVREIRFICSNGYVVNKILVVDDNVLSTRFPKGAIL